MADQVKGISSLGGLSDPAVFATSYPIFHRLRKPAKELFEKLIEVVPKRFRPSLRGKVTDLLAKYPRTLPFTGDIQTSFSLQEAGKKAPRRIAIGEWGGLYKPYDTRILENIPPDASGDFLQDEILKAIRKKPRADYGIVVFDDWEYPLNENSVIETLAHELSHHGQSILPGNRVSRLDDMSDIPYRARLVEILARAGAEKRLKRLLGESYDPKQYGVRKAILKYYMDTSDREADAILRQLYKMRSTVGGHTLSPKHLFWDELATDVNNIYYPMRHVRKVEQGK